MKTFENSYNPNAENPYKDIVSNTEQLEPEIVKAIKTERELQELTVLTKDTELQIDIEMAELKKVIDRLPKEEKNELRKKIEKGFILVSAGFMLFAAVGCGQAGREFDRGFGKNVQQSFDPNHLTEQQRRTYENEAARNRVDYYNDLRSSDSNVKVNAEKNYYLKMKVLKDAYGIK